MKKSTLYILAIFTASAFAADGPELRNGDFEKGKQHWRGNGKVVTLPTGGKACELKASQRYSDELTQELDFDKVTEVELTWKMKSEGYKGSGLKISFIRPSGGFTYNTFKMPDDANWKEMKMKFTRTTPEEKIVLTFSPNMGEGSILIDNVVITYPGSTAPKLQ